MFTGSKFKLFLVKLGIHLQVFFFSSVFSVGFNSRFQHLIIINVVIVLDLTSVAKRQKRPQTKGGRGQRLEMGSL